MTLSASVTGRIGDDLAAQLASWLAANGLTASVHFDWAYTDDEKEQSSTPEVEIVWVQTVPKRPGLGAVLLIRTFALLVHRQTSVSDADPAGLRSENDPAMQIVDGICSWLFVNDAADNAREFDVAGGTAAVCIETDARGGDHLAKHFKERRGLHVPIIATFRSYQ